jgi:hypothetical protein
MGMTPALFTSTSLAVSLQRFLDQIFYLHALGHIHGHSKGIPTFCGDVFDNRIQAITAAGTQDNRSTKFGKVASGALAQPTAGTGNDNDFSFDVPAHAISSAQKVKTQVTG